MDRIGGFVLTCKEKKENGEAESNTLLLSFSGPSDPHTCVHSSHAMLYTTTFPSRVAHSS